MYAGSVAGTVPSTKDRRLRPGKSRQQDEQQQASAQRKGKTFNARMPSPCLQ